LQHFCSKWCSSNCHCMHRGQHMHISFNRHCQHHTQQLEVSHLALRNMDGMSYNTAIYKEPETTLLMFTKHSPEARQLKLCCPSCCPTHHASSSSCFQWHVPVPTTAWCAFHIQIGAQTCFDEHVHAGCRQSVGTRLCHSLWQCMHTTRTGSNRGNICTCNQAM